MKFQKGNTPIPDSLNSDSAALSCPLLNIPRINEHGMVLETRCGYEVGSAIVLGFHLQYDNARNPAKQSKQGQSYPDSSTFISVEAIVVDSKMGSGTAGQPVYLVTVLFSQISREDREHLLRYSGSSPARPKRQHYPPSPSSSAPWDFSEKIRREANQRIHLN